MPARSGTIGPRTMPPPNHTHTPPAGSAPDPDDTRDLELVERIGKGDQDAWSELLERYQHRLFTVCLRMVNDRHLASDLTQDAMVKIIRGLETYDGRSKLSTWMIRVTMNVCFSRLRAEKLRRHLSLDGSPDSSHSGPNRPDPGIEQNREPPARQRVELDERRHILSQALTMLSPDQRAIIILRDARGLDYQHIAEVLDIAPGTVKSRLFRARAALRNACDAIENPSSQASPHSPDARSSSTPPSTP